MAQPTTRVARRVISSTPARTFGILSTSSRPFATTTPIRKVPSLADVESSNAPSFDAAQKEFRERLAAQKVQQDSKTLRDARHDAYAASEVSSAARSAEQALDSPTLLGDAREAARAADDHPSTFDKNGDKKKQGVVSRLIHGTEEGRLHEKELEQSFSQVLARGKYVHSITFHEVKPEKVEEYTDLVGEFYPRAAQDPQNKVKLVGSWRTEVGDSDTFVHIWEYERYHGFHDSMHTIAHHSDFAEYDRRLKECIKSKHISLMQEFSFWPTTSPRKLGGVFELRSYKLHPGNLLEWETHWRKGLDARRQVMEGVGAWFVQIGDLNTVHHLWQFANLEERKVRREQSWAIEGWSDTVHKTVPLIQSMQSRVLVPCQWSPIG